MKIRTATIGDLDRITEVESICFPAAEAATRKSLQDRLSCYPNHFWLMEDDEKLVGFVNGMVTNFPHLTDEMYEDASMHNENGDWQMIFGVDVIPEYRRQGVAEQLIRLVIEESKRQGRMGIVLTCKDALVHYYAKFGFIDEGISDSEHGGVTWHEMRLSLF